MNWYRAAVVGLGFMVVLTGCTTSTARQAPRVPITVPTTPTGPQAPAETFGTPTEIDIPVLKAHSTLVPLGLIDPKTHKPDPHGVLDVPDVHNPGQAGYYAQGVMPCGKPGPAVVVGHVDGRVAGKPTPGIFFDLKKLTEGDTINITMSTGGKCSYRVYSVIHVDKTQFPNERVFGDTEKPELRAITCGDQFVGGEMGYKNNIIALAKLAGT